MIFTATKLAGAFLIDLDRKEDVRGYFARVFCVEKFRAKGLNPQVAQCSISFNPRKGTLRGMHWQAAPKAEAKLIRLRARRNLRRHRGPAADVTDLPELGKLRAP